MIPKIEVTPYMMQEAQRMCDEVMRTQTIQGSPNYTGLHAKDRFLVGYIGELAFVQFLIESLVDHKYVPRTDGVPDSGDIYVFGKRSVNIDVKTASQGFHQCLMIPQRQYRERMMEKGIDIVVGARWHRESEYVSLMGAIEFDALESIADMREMGDGQAPPVKIPTVLVPFPRLTMTAYDMTWI